ncbi:MAG: hypothetical protein KL787_10340 [Taibaiella sp.]|nr:hypothetical protein [Taibaiella sp.]
MLHIIILNDDDTEVPWAYGLAYIQDPDAGMGPQEYKILSFDPLNIVYAIDPETGYSDPFCMIY